MSHRRDDRSSDVDELVFAVAAVAFAVAFVRESQCAARLLVIAVRGEIEDEGCVQA